ncbi:hypothetical protein PFISCL1PPCAC_4813, partial [Pristionchus fissidentatus]
SMATRSVGRKRGDEMTSPLKAESTTTPPKQARTARDRTPARSTARTEKNVAKMMEKMDVDSDDDMPAVRKGRGEEKKEEEERENRLPFANETVIDESVSLSAIENYFLKGKNVQQNKQRRRRTKKDKRGDRDESQEDEDTAEEGKEGEKEEEGDSRYAECDLNALRKYHEKSRKLVEKTVRELGEEHFDHWTLHLATGFNVLVHGLGSIRPLLHDYAHRMSGLYTVLEVEAFRPECTPRSILNSIYELLHLKFQKGRSVTSWARQTVEAVTDRDVILVIHGIDEPPFRCDNDMEVLAILCSSPYFHLVASAQHNNRMILWNSRSIASFNWLHVNIDTWLPAEAEIFAGSSSLLGLSSAASAANHTISSLEVLWQSLNNNARFIFHAIFSLVYGTQAEGEAKSVSFWDLFNVSKDNFWVSSDAALRQQLVEFSDHRLIRMRRGNDGNEKIYPTADRSIIDRFLKGVDMPLEEMQVGEEE